LHFLSLSGVPGFFFFQPPLADLAWHEIELPWHEIELPWHEIELAWHEIELPNPAVSDSYSAVGRAVHSLQIERFSLAHFTAEQLSVTIS